MCNNKKKTLHAWTHISTHTERCYHRDIVKKWVSKDYATLYICNIASGGQHMEPPLYPNSQSVSDHSLQKLLLSLSFKTP